MAMDGSGLGQKIVAELKNAGFSPTGDHTVDSPFWDAIGKAIVAHIQQNAKANVQSGNSAGQWPIE